MTQDLLHAAWSLHHNVAARDAWYVAATQAMAGRLLTTDDRLTRAVPTIVQPLR